MATELRTDVAFRELYESTFDDIRRYCLRRLPAFDVNDAIADVYLAAWTNVERIPTGEHALLWLYGVARNVVRHAERSNLRRRRLRARALQEPAYMAPNDPEVQLVRRHEDEELAQAIDALSSSDREVLRLRAWEGLTAREIADVMDCSVAAAEKRVSRATKRLERSLRERTFVPGRVLDLKDGGT